ncbi:MAG: hypothetical protein E3J72_03525 [Planctomycetota bacterium]|nr:MAG: hypothetical protein E3J72_03525 [Planctomycetota bacterium]
MKKYFTLIVIAVAFGLIVATPGCGGSHKSGRSGGGSPGGGGTGTGTGGGTGGGGGGGGGGNVSLPFGGSSGGTGGSGSGNGLTTSSGVSYNLIVPSSYGEGSPNEFMVVYSGNEGVGTMTSNLYSIPTRTGTSHYIFAVLDGPTYGTSGQPGSDVLDEVRASYNINNDMTYCLGESRGTGGAANLAFELRQDVFAAYWANDITQAISAHHPAQTASELGFAPWGNAGPGSQVALAQQVVQEMRDAGYQLPDDAPYSGPGYMDHGSIDQLEAALSFFVGKSRQ